MVVVPSWARVPAPRHFQWTNGQPLSTIPKELNHPVQGCPIPRGLPWVVVWETINAESVESPRLMNQRSIQRPQPRGAMSTSTARAF